MEFPIPILSALIGAIILLFGRKLFWLCVSAVGFAVGVEATPYLFHESRTLLALTLAVVLGFVGALLALFLQKIAVGIVGFLAGGRLAIGIAAAFFAHQAHYFGITFLVGGIVGAMLFLALFDWALIFFSSAVGAYLIQSAVTLPSSGSSVLFVVLAAIGAVVQVTAMRGSRAGVA
jgi:hypothetical protein